MPDGAKTLLVLLLIPFLLGLGHDVYFNYFADDAKIKAFKKMQIDPEEFLISDLGWVWNEYSPNTMETMRDSTEQESWVSYVDPVLQLPTMVVGLIPFAIVAAYLLLAWILGIWPCQGRHINIGGTRKRGKKEDFSAYKNAKLKKTKYKK